MHKSFKDCIFLAFVTVTLTFLIWLPHILSLPNLWGLTFESGFNTIYRNFDGLEYIIIAKTFYDPQAIAALNQTLPANYFASHFPGYSILIYLFAPIFGYLKSMLFVSLVSTVAAVIAFYYLVKNFKLSSNPLFLSVVFLILPARWVIVHSVGSSEPTFIFFVIAALYFFMKHEQTQNNVHILLTAIFGMLAQITRPPGILLFIALSFYILWKLIEKKVSIIETVKKYFVLFLIPLSLFGVFYLYGQTYGDFWAYFHSGDNIHLTFPPFQVFNKQQFWVGDIWLEDIIYIFILGFLGGILLLKQRLYPLAFFVLTYLVATTLVIHRDISRYLLPATPFILIAFDKILTSKEFKIVLAVLLLAIYLYSQNFLIANAAPIPNLSLFDKYP